MHSLPIIIILLSNLAIASSANCPPRACNRLKIRHPFWISGLHEPHCGLPGFNITCHDNKPETRINHVSFIIRDIFYKNTSFVLTQSDALGARIRCPTPQSNFSVDGTPFTYGPSTTDLFFFYDCTIPYDRGTYAVDCASNASHHSFAVFHVELLRRWNYSARSCRAVVNAAVETDDIDQLLKMNFTGILSKGFVLQWKERSGNREELGRVVKIGIGVGAAIGTTVMCITFLICRRHNAHYPSRCSLSRGYTPHPSLEKDVEKAGVHIFDYHELEVATNHFDPERELGDGGYGAVYKGKLQDGRAVAVKRLYENHLKRVEQFKNEVEILTHLRHRNLVSLYGCTSSHSRELLLVYEYIPNGTLADHLHGHRAKPGSLSWTTRLNIAIEIASALAYLHASDVIHRDIKTTNILLDSNFVVKVADFGLSRLVPPDVTHVSTAPQGTPGYVDPEYNDCYQLTEKSDVYSFGVVLMELISSKPAIDITRHRQEINLATMAVSKIQNHALHQLVDPHLGFESDYKVRLMIVAVAELGFQCLQIARDTRPPMGDVVNVLQEIQSKDYSTDVMDIPAPADYMHSTDHEEYFYLPLSPN